GAAADRDRDGALAGQANGRAQPDAVPSAPRGTGELRRSDQRAAGRRREGRPAMEASVAANEREPSRVAAEPEPHGVVAGAGAPALPREAPRSLGEVRDAAVAQHAPAVRVPEEVDRGRLPDAPTDREAQAVADRRDLRAAEAGGGRARARRLGRGAGCGGAAAGVLAEAVGVDA